MQPWPFRQAYLAKPTKPSPQSAQPNPSSRSAHAPKPTQPSPKNNAHKDDPGLTKWAWLRGLSWMGFALWTWLLGCGCVELTAWAQLNGLRRVSLAAWVLAG